MNPYQTLAEQLPDAMQATISAIADKTIHLEIPLRVCVVGEFSAGKSSLLNALIGENLLPTAREETTALPTFIEYAAELRVELVATDGTNSVITQEQFASYTVTAPDNALCSMLYYPAAWLEGLSLIDLPGLGSQSQQHSDYTTAQISAADAIIYLLSPRGATQGDLKLLRLIKQYGKQLMIAVAQWDSVEKSIQEGEQAPDLNEWQAHIARETGLNLALFGVSKYGYGRDAVIGFLQQSKQNLQQIREQRFQAELVPFLTNTVGQINAEQAVCTAKSVAETQALHNELLTQRETLLTLKTELYERSNQDQTQLEEKSQQLVSQQRDQLSGDLLTIPVATNKDDWQSLTDLAYQLLQKQVLSTADNLKNLSNDYGQLDLPEIVIKQFNLRLPPPEPIELDDFIDNSRLSALEDELEKKHQAIEADKAKVEALPNVDLEDRQQQLSELRAERNEIAQQELPRIMQTIEGSDDVAQLGKNIGQLLDVALIVFEGPAVIVKAASMLGKGAKAAKVIHTANKVSQVISDPRLGFLEKLSLSYWGEQLGKRFDQPTCDIEIVDPYAEEQQRRLLQEQDKQIALQRAELRRLEDLQQQRDYSDWALQQNLNEQEQLKQTIQALQDKAFAAQQEAQAEQIRQHQALLESYRQQLINQSLLHFDQQTRPMLNLLRTSCKRYWQEQVEGTLTERLQSIELLNQQLQQAPEQKQAMLAQFQQQLTQVQAILESLKAGDNVD